MSTAPRILIFTGDGKGKTTAALGMALRAAGHDMRVCVVQFIKNDTTVGELAGAGLARIEIVQAGRGFLPKPGDPRLAEHRAAAAEALRHAGQVIAGGQYGLVILDEICVAVAHGLVEEPQVAEVLAQARPAACIVLTGRGATEGLIALADTVTEMRPIKHAYQAGRSAQKGVEW
jgi:cob(I)alamin adenosyltransferase